MKKFLLGIGHPAHIHFLRNFAKDEIAKGNQVLFVCNKRPMHRELLESYGLPYKQFGKRYNSKIGKAWSIIYRTLRTMLVALRFRPDVYINGSLPLAFNAKLFGKPFFALEDTYNMEQIKYLLPLTSAVLTGDYEHPSLGPSQLIYPGYHALYYLHPKRFKPNPENRGAINSKKYVIIRFVKWDATHDWGHNGMSNESKIRAVREFSKYADVYISSEAELPDELKPYQIKIRPEQMHDVLSGASLVFGEGATMVEEAIMLGVPGIFFNYNCIYYLAHIENKYQMCYNYTESAEDQQKGIDKGIEILSDPNAAQVYRQRGQRLLSDCIDCTAYLEWLTENWPQSKKILEEDPEYINNFK